MREAASSAACVLCGSENVRPSVCSAEHWECLPRIEPLPTRLQAGEFGRGSKLMTTAGNEAISIQVMFVFKSSSKSVRFLFQQRFGVTERRCDCMKLCRDHFWCVFYKLAAKVVTLPLFALRPFRNHHTMPFSSSRGSKASQRCISHGKLSISADEMAT